MPKPTYFATPAAFRAWLEANHAIETELFVGLHKKVSGKPSMNWSQAVDEALCFGWIDGRGQSLGAEAWMIRFTPRKPTSIWSLVNVAKITALREAGKMRPAGEAAFARRSEAKTGVYSFERDKPAAFTRAQAKQLAADAKGHAWFTSQAPWYQRTVTHWVISAKQEATRERRLAELIRCNGKGERVASSNAGRSKPAKATTKPAPKAAKAADTKVTKPRNKKR